MTGSATLEATTAHGLQVKSLKFGIDDANFGALELKDVGIEYTMEGEVWKGKGKLEIPAGGGVFEAEVTVEFDKGEFQSGSVDVGLPYPGIPLDDNDLPAAQLYLSHGGLGLGLNPLTLSGKVGFGVTPLAAPGKGGEHDFAFGLEGKLSVAFGKPVTMTVNATGFLYKIQFAQATLTYKIPNQVELTGSAHLNLGIVEFDGQLGAIIDTKHGVFGALIESGVTIDLGAKIHLHGPSFAINNYGFAAYEPPPGVCIPLTPLCAWGTVTYHWGDSLPAPHFYQDAFSGPYTAGIPRAGGARAHAHAAATGFTVPAHAPTATIVVHGSGGAPSIVLVAPDGQRITPNAGNAGAGEIAQAFPEASTSTTYAGIQNPRPGSWGVEQAAGSPTAITGIEYSIGEPAPKIKAKVTGRALRRTLHYHATVPGNVKVTLVEQAKGFSHVIGQVRGANGTIHFRPAFGPTGRRQLVAQITRESLPVTTQTLGSFVVPRPPRPGRAKKLHVSARGRALSFSFTPPANSAHTLLRIVATDGRHLQQIVPPRTRRGSVPAIGFGDGITVTVIGLAEDGSRGPAVKASARQALPKTPKPKRRKSRH